MEARNLPDALRMIMEQRGWSQLDLAHELGISQPFVSNLLSGKRETGFTKAIRLLDRVDWQVRITPKSEDDDPVKRREFVTAAASVAFVPSSTIGPYQDPAYLRELARRTARDRYERGGITSVSTAMRHVHRIKQALDGRDRELQAAASDLAVEAVWTLNDISRDARRLDAGENVGRLALELAHRSGDTDAQSRAYSVLARVQRYRRKADLAVTYAQQGTRLHDVPADQQAWMKLRLADSLSMVPGLERATRDVIDDVQVFVADGRSSGALTSFDAADLTGKAGQLLYDVGAYEEAQAALDEAVRGLGHSVPLLQGICLAHQVRASLRMARPENAADRMLALARIAPLVDSARLDGQLRGTVALSAGWRAVPEVAAARAQLRTVLQGTPAGA